MPLCLPPRVYADAAEFVLQTLTVIAAAMHAAKNEKQAGQRPPSLPSLIVCPTTLVGHWMAEAAKWFGYHGMKTVKYQGTLDARLAVQRQPQWGVDTLVVTSYECVRSDIAWLSQKPFLYCVLDEGHIIRNGKTKVTKACKQVPSPPTDRFSLHAWRHGVRSAHSPV